MSLGLYTTTKACPFKKYGNNGSKQKTDYLTREHGYISWLSARILVINKTPAEDGHSNGRHESTAVRQVDSLARGHA